MTLASDVMCEVTGHEISGRAKTSARETAIVRTFPYIQSCLFLFQRLKYCITSRSRWQPICGKAKCGVFRYSFRADVDRVSSVYENLSSFPGRSVSQLTYC